METKNSILNDDVWFVIFCAESKKDSVIKLLGCLSDFSVESHDLELIPVDSIYKVLVVFRCTFKEASVVASILQSLGSLKYLVYDHSVKE